MNIQISPDGGHPTWRGKPVPLHRAWIEAEIDRLIDLLNVADGDEDLEPYLAGFEEVTDDREGDYVAPVFNGTADDEPSLGWCGNGQFGHNDDREEEHDGTEPENEHGEGWTEHSALHGRLFNGFSGREDDEPWLGFTEHVNQCRRLAETQDCHVVDGEADYVGRFAKGREADDEPSCGSRSVRTARGVEIDDPEGVEEGRGDGLDHGHDPQDSPSEDFLISPLPFDGSGHRIAQQMLLKAVRK